MHVKTWENFWGCSSKKLQWLLLIGANHWLGTPESTTPPIQLLMVTLRTCPYEDRKWTESCCYAAGRYGLALSKKINNMNKHIENKVIKHRF
jgi:hypothetical protein